MTCPPCNHNCRQGRDCPARAAAPDTWGIGIVFIFAVLCLLGGFAFVYLR